MRKLLVVLMASLVLILAACGGNDSNSDTDTVIVGGKNFTEQLILTHIIANYLEEHTDLNIVNKAGVGATDVTHTAIINDEIDLYVEYTGTGYMSALKLEMDPINPEDADT